MLRRLMPAFALTLFAFGPMGCTAAPKPESKGQNSGLIRECVACFYFGDSSQDGGALPKGLQPGEPLDWEKWRALAVRAEKSFKDMTSAELARTLSSQRNLTHRGSASYVSIAFVLASRGIDFHANVDRMLTTYERLDWDADLKAWNRNNERWHWAPPAEIVPDCLADFYRRTKDSFVLRRLLAIRTDGAFAEIQGDNISRLLEAYPREVIRVALERPAAFKKLRGSVVAGFDGPPDGLKPRLKAVARGHDRVLARAARTLLADMARGAITN